MIYYIVSLVLFFLGLTQYILAHFNISLQGIIVRAFHLAFSPGYYDYVYTPEEKEEVEREHTAWLDRTLPAHIDHIEKCTLIREAQERTKEELEHNSRSPIYDEYGQELRENGDPVWILK